MKISNWSVAGIGFGLLFSLFTSWRYFIQYQDTSFALICVLIGCLIMAISWLYDKQLQHSNKLTAIGDYLSNEN